MDRIDSLANTLSGLGVENRDKGVSSRPSRPAPLTPDELEILYEEDAIARRIVDLPVAESIRRGWRFRVAEADADEEIDPFADDLDRLKARRALADADRWARLYGGGAVIVGVDDGRDAVLPVAEESIRRVRFLRAVDRWEIRPLSYYGQPPLDGEEIDPDLELERVGEPRLYELRPHTVSSGRSALGGAVGERIHESRVLRFDGAPVPRRRAASLDGWGLSALEAVWSRLSRLAGVEGAIGHLIHEWRIAVLEMKGLFDLAKGPDGTSKVASRLSLLKLGQGITGLTVLDADNESFTQQQVPVTGLPELYDRLAQSVAAAAGMPVTLLFGQSPGGLSTDDASGRTAFYDTIAARQEDRYRDPLLRLARLLALAAEGPDVAPDAELDLDFAPLLEPTETEVVAMRATIAGVDKVYWEMGALDEIEIRRSRFGGRWTPDTRLMDAGEREEAAAEDGFEAAPAPPVPPPGMMPPPPGAPAPPPPPGTPPTPPEPVEEGEEEDDEETPPARG